MDTVFWTILAFFFPFFYLIMLITDKGVLVRTRVSEVREMGRATQGVTLIAVDDGSQLAGLQRIVESDLPDLPDAALAESGSSDGSPEDGSDVDPGVDPEADPAGDQG